MSEKNNTDLANEFETRLRKRFPDCSDDWYVQSTTALLGPTMQQLEITQSQLVAVTAERDELREMDALAQKAVDVIDIGAVQPQS